MKKVILLIWVLISGIHLLNAQINTKSKSSLPSQKNHVFQVQHSPVQQLQNITPQQSRNSSLLQSQNTSQENLLFIPFPANFFGSDFYLFNNYFAGIWGFYRQNDSVFNSLIYIYDYNSSLNTSAWSEGDSLTHKYYNQFRQLKFDYESHNFFFYDYTLNYIFKVNEGSHTGFMDSIPQASGINELNVCKDSLLYASITNHNKNYIVRKKGSAGSWEVLPILISQPDKLDSIKNVLSIVIVICCVIAVYLLILFTKKGKEILSLTKKDTSVLNDLKLQADRPLDLEDLPEGDMKRCVNAIVQVIRNRNTPLPMTAAINGAWGSGKSTIMNCIRQELDKDSEERFITTWFNAWHQQTESSLLDAFLLKIINRYEKPFFKNKWRKAFFAFIRFRFNLASSRFIKWSVFNQFISGFALTFLTLVVAIIIINIYGYANDAIFAKIGLPNINLATLFSGGNFTSVQTISSIIALIISVGSFFILRSETAPTLGAFLNVIYKKTFLVDAEKNAPDFREKFRTQYWEMMEAVEEKVLVVFIDDLDRVEGNKIFEMLEALNFIGDATSRPDDSEKHSLQTVFVLGLYIDQVAEHLGIYLQKENPFTNADPATAKEEAKILGKRYLEKMIQLNVPVPLTN